MKETDTTLEFVRVLVQAAAEKKAENPVILDLRKISSVCDFFLILTGNSQPQIQAIGSVLVETARSLGYKLHHREGQKQGHWLVLDFFSVIVHIFDDETRRFYDLEHLWLDAPRLKLPRGEKVA